MNIQKWFRGLVNDGPKKALPILSFPSVSLLDVSVNDLITDSELMARGICAIADRCEMLAAVGMMDLSVEADSFGSTVHLSDNEVPTVTGRLVTDEADVDALDVPEVRSGRAGIYLDAMQKAKASITDRPVFAGTIGPFSLGGRLMDLTEIMVSCYTDPIVVHKCVEKATLFITAYVRGFKSAGADGVLIAEPAAGLLSPQLIEEFSTPYVRRIVEAVQTPEFGVLYHNCGNTVPLIDSIKKIGASGYHFGNAVDMVKVLELMPTDVPVFGNVDPAGQFRHGTPESVYKTTVELIMRCKAYPNYIPSSGCDIPPLTPWDNIDAFFKAVADAYR